MQDVGRGDGLDYPTRWLLGVRFSAMPGALFLFLEPTTCPRFAFVRILSSLALFVYSGRMDIAS